MEREFGDSGGREGIQSQKKTLEFYSEKLNCQFPFRQLGGTQLEMSECQSGDCPGNRG